jgi:hypothetical protein
MKPAVGVVVELAILVFLVTLVRAFQPGLLLWLYVILVELASTYLVHCPAHYLVGSAFGIRFRNIRLGETTLAKVLPKSLSGLTKAVPILTLSTEKATMARVSKGRRAWMYASGTVASSASGLVGAAAATLIVPQTFALLAWAFALGYLAFDVVFSPRSGDLFRARLALRA